MLNEVHLRYGDEVSVLIIGINSAFDWNAVDDFAAVTNYKGTPLLGSPGTIQAYGILSQSTKIALDSAGKVVFRKSYGSMDENDWVELLDELTS